MRKIWIESMGTAVVLAAVTAAAGQPGPADPLAQPKQPKVEPPRPAPADPKPAAKDEKKVPPKSRLEEMLEEALQHNPDIHVADAKLREAEAELNRTRLLVTQKVVALYAALDAARAQVAVTERRLERFRALYKDKAVPAEEVENAAAALQQAKADLAKLEAEAPYITGRHPKDVNTDEAVRRGIDLLHWTQRREALRAEEVHARYAAALALAGLAAAEDKPATDRVRAALNKPVTAEFSKKAPPAILEQITALVPDLPIHVKYDASWGIPESVATARFKEVPLAVVLQWFEDALPHHRAYVRDYGVLFLPSEQRAPAGAVPLREFWKAAKAEPKDKPEKE